MKCSPLYFGEKGRGGGDELDNAVASNVASSRGIGKREGPSEGKKNLLHH